MSHKWPPCEGERIYVEVEHKTGRIIARETDGDDHVYIGELKADAGAIRVNQARHWGYEQPDCLRCTLEELAPT